MFPIYLQDIFKRSCKNLFKASSRRIAKTSSRRIQNAFQTSCKDVSITFSRCLQHLQDVFKVYHRVKLFLLTCLQCIFNTFWRSIAKKINYRKICRGRMNTCLRNIWSGCKFSKSELFGY